MIENTPPSPKRSPLDAGQVTLIVTAFMLQLVGFTVPIAVVIGVGAGAFAAALEEEFNAQGLTGEDLFGEGLTDDDSMPSSAEARALANATLTEADSLIPFNTIISEEGDWEEFRCSSTAWDGSDVYYARSSKTFEVAAGTSESTKQTIADYYAEAGWPVYDGGVGEPTWVSFDLSESADDIDLQSYDDALGVQAFSEGGREYVLVISDEGCYR